MKLILVRHGETEWNGLGRYQGQSDIELNGVGLEQAERLRDRFKDEKIDSVYCSDLKRSIQTAEPIASAHGVRLTRVKELRELDFGEFEGKYFGDIEHRYMALEKSWRAGNLDVSVPGGESLAEMDARTTNFVGMIREHHVDGAVLVVAHGGPLKMIVCQLIGLNLRYWWRLHLDIASVSVINLHPDFDVLMLFNDTCHLGGAE